jgi:hypothetical protein
MVPVDEAPRNDFIYVNDVAFDDGGERVARSDVYTVSLKEVKSGRTPKRLVFPRGGMVSMAFAPDGQSLAVAESGRGIGFFDAQTGEVRCWQKVGWGAAFSRDGRYVAWAEESSLEIRESADVLAGDNRAPPPVSSDPTGVPLQAELIAGKEPHVLDLGGPTADQFSRQIGMGRFPPTPMVELVFRLRNVGDKAITFQPSSQPNLFLVGDGAVNLLYPAPTGVHSSPDNIVLQPGKGHSIRITNLNFGPGRKSFWLLPGEYTAHASYHTSVSPAPKGARDTGDGFGWVTIRSDPVKLKVIGGRR